MIRNLSIMLFFLSLQFLCACAVKVKMPAHRFMSPESTGKTLGGKVELGSIGAADVTVIGDSLDASPSTTPKIENNTAIGVGLHLGIIPHLDLYGSSSSEGPSFVGGKLQLFGDTYQSAKTGNLSMALYGGVALGSADSTSEGDVSGNDTEASVEAMFTGWEAGVLIGYRPDDLVLIYVGPYMSSMEAEITLDHKNKATGATARIVNPKGEGEVQSAVLGLQLGRRVMLQGEVALMKANWKRTSPSEYEVDEYTDTVYGANLSFNW